VARVFKLVYVATVVMRMRQMDSFRAGFFFALVLLSLNLTGYAAPTNNLAWATKDKTLSADLRDVPLEKVLARVGSLTKWKVFVEPGLQHPVSVKFKETPTAEALRLVLGDVNFALVPGPQKKLYVYRNSLQDATEAVAAEGKPKNWLANEILLTVSPDSKENIEELTKALGGKIVGQSTNLHAFRLQFPNAEAAQAARDKISTHDDMEVNDNFQYQAPDRTDARGVAASPASSSASSSSANNGQVTVALIDTPIQVDGNLKDSTLPSVHVAGEANPDPSHPTHGTSMAKIISNGDGSVKILPIDVYGSNGSTTTFEVGQGLYAAIREHPAIINMSLGGAGDSEFLDYLLDIAKDQKIIVFASAGNEPTTDPTYPAANPNVIAVTAAKRDGEIADYANRGSFVDIKGPGTRAIDYDGRLFISTGTSTATAWISGQTAALIQGGMPADQALQKILQIYNVNTPARK
jgi:thermitase